MDPKFQTSFIPKNPTLSQSKASTISIPGGNIFNTLAVTLFILTLLLIGVLFGYEMILNGKIDDANKQIIATKDSYQIDAIQNIIDANFRITSTKTILSNHVATSELFKLFQTLTVKKVRFNNFLFSNKGGIYTVVMDVEAQSYNALLQQYDTLLKSTDIQNPRFTGFDLTASGNVKSKLTASVDPNSVSYNKTMQTLFPNQ